MLSFELYLILPLHVLVLSILTSLNNFGCVKEFLLSSIRIISTFLNPVPNEKFRLFQTEIICRRSTWKNMAESSPGRKHRGIWRNCSF